MVAPWTDREKREIVAEYKRTGIARCPDDRELLHIMRLPRLGGHAVAVLFQCPVCMRHFDSTNLQKSM